MMGVDRLTTVPGASVPLPGSAWPLVSASNDESAVSRIRRAYQRLIVAASPRECRFSEAISTLSEATRQHRSEGDLSSGRPRFGAAEATWSDCRLGRSTDPNAGVLEEGVLRVRFRRTEGR